MFTHQTSSFGLKILATAAIGFSAISAHAWVLSIDGTYNPSNPGTTLTVTNEYSTLLTTGFSVAYDTLSFGGGSSSGSFGFDGSSILNLTFSGTDTKAGGTDSLAGTWSEVSGTTAPVASSGTYSATFDGIGNFEFAFSGSQAVPEPISVLALGTGLIGLIARRKKS